MHSNFPPAVVASAAVTASEIVVGAPWGAVIANIVVTLCVACTVALIRSIGRREK